MNDGHPRYSGSCGRCYAIRCKPGTFKDNLGQTISRDNDCFNTNPVVVTITDTCPCDKPNNAYSNKRWCCGDMDHFDIGVWAFKKFADPSKGVVQIEYMETPCGTDASSLPVGPAGQRAR
ncbi:expansin-like EG45 domain-containing protein [Haematococcus lacustris]|uniref:Expansin-like EG45 domain-containing protein n=1 Tax=Haematococcus lacustris TaxID=44745 RepID=A0A6A0ABQ1_HAELA|nr:expansin-like EG45 domain-containing protein [Haematococcus lacustris]